LLIDGSTLIFLAIGMVILWILITAPVMYYLSQVEVPEKWIEIRSGAFESVLDALELACGLLILLQFNTDMNARDTVLFILVVASWINIGGYAVYSCSLLRISAETLDLTAYHKFVGIHTCFTMLVLFPELALETSQFIESDEMTDLLGVMGLCLDLGVRLKAAGTFLNNREKPEPDVKIEVNSDHAAHANTIELQSTVAAQAQEIADLRQRSVALSQKLELATNSGMMFSSCTPFRQQ